MASSVPSQNRSSSPARTRVWPLEPSSRSVSPRTTATGMPVSLPLTRSAAAAISSATATSVTTSSLPWSSCAPRVAVQHGQARGADRGVGLAVAPGATHRVGDDDADGDAEQSSRVGLAVVAALPSGSTGSSASSAESTLDPSTPAAAWMRPIAFSVISVRPLRASTRTASASIEPAPQGISLLGIRRCRDDAALALGEHLAGDHDDVVVAQPGGGRGDRGGHVVTGPELGQAWHGQDLDGGRCAVLGGSIESVTRPSETREFDSAAHHLGGGLRVGHQQRDGADVDAVDGRGRHRRR